MARRSPIPSWPNLKKPPWHVWIWYRIRRVGHQLTPVLFILALLVLVAAAIEKRYFRLGGPSHVETPTTLEKVIRGNPLYHRPEMAPNGSPWPESSGYVAGYPRLNVGGLAEVLVDNSGGASDLFVKLVDRSVTPVRAVRVVFLKTEQVFTLRAVEPGHYDVRYLNLDSGRIRRSGVVEVTLKKTAKGPQYMGWKVGLYDVVAGNNFHEDITEKDF